MPAYGVDSAAFKGFNDQTAQDGSCMLAQPGVVDIAEVPTVYSRVGAGQRLDVSSTGFLGPLQMAPADTI